MSNLQFELNHISKKLKELELEHGKAINQKTIFKRAGKVVLQKLQSNAPEDTGELKKSHAFINRRRDKTGILVGARYFSNTNSEGEKTNATGKHSHLMEFGWIDRSGKRHEGRPYVKQSYEQTKNQVESNLIKEIDKVQKKFERQR